MNIIVFIYACIMFITGILGIKNELKISKITLTVIDLLFLLTLINLWSSLNLLDIVISILLLALSITLYRDRLLSGRQINISHHVLRLIIHFTLIYFLFN
ncbi:hypothetical protein [Facklamia sp. 7083-14-GEN3]|uniref:hypothetical protein n=1 Tax=Facklamia sp. 7083-14-GEN3 TaxID=2973478 RepID=UPI00215CBDE3|nr:hypothetical protein [Facklamia sp. 7083-14-GEN3]MCR8969247.1 hypothetical protein [Facklamia sp. 7083-14-GEN3]